MSQPHQTAKQHPALTRRFLHEIVRHLLHLVCFGGHLLLKTTVFGWVKTIQNHGSPGQNPKIVGE
jgi:hypothetical protein